MVVIHVSCPFNRLAEVGVIAHIDIRYPHTVRCPAELISIHHLCTLENLLEAETAVVGYLKLLVLALFRCHLDDTCCTTAAILCRLRSIFQDGEALDIGRKDG